MKLLVPTPTPALVVLISRSQVSAMSHAKPMKPQAMKRLAKMVRPAPHPGLITYLRPLSATPGPPLAYINSVVSFTRPTILGLNP